MPQQNDTKLETEILQIQSLGLAELRALWTKQLGRPPKHQSVELLRRRLAYAMQERAKSGLKPSTVRQLKSLHQALKSNPAWTPLPYRSLAVGTVLTKTWNGKTHNVSVLDEGFEYMEQQYESLSEVARLITGTRRSGPAFFGFRDVAR